MTKKSFLYLLINLLVFNNAVAQRPKEKITQNLIGYTWKYNIGPYNKRSTDSCQIYTTYKFREDGKVEIRPIDISKCDNWAYIRIWKLIKLHDLRGKTYFGVRITEQEMPERQSYDDFTFEDKIFLIVDIKNGALSWVLKPAYNQPSIKDAVNYLQNQ